MEYPPANTRPSEPAASPAPARCLGRVLVMDDEELVREALAAILEELEYAAETVENGEQALVSCRRAIAAGTPFDAVVLDLTVPGGMGGVDTLEALRAVDPHVKAIVSSGFGDDPVVTDYRRNGFAGVLSKPFRLSDLADLLAEILGAGPGE